MIALLQGSVMEANDGRVVVDAAGVGYEVSVPRTDVGALPTVGETVRLHIRLIWREDGPSLYGFVTAWDKRLFDLLLSVTGVGPKVALTMIGALGSEALAQTIALADAKRLQRIPGVGEKTARRIVLELADKLAEAAFERRIDSVSTEHSQHTTSADAADALVTMGFRAAEARTAVEAALKELPADVTVETAIKEALKRVRTRA